jgi:hypothetical protein
MYDSDKGDQAGTLYGWIAYGLLTTTIGESRDYVKLGMTSQLPASVCSGGGG